MHQLSFLVQASSSTVSTMASSVFLVIRKGIFVIAKGSNVAQKKSGAKN